jgi:MFS family permease
VTATLVSSAVFTILTSILERRIGRKRLPALFAALMSLAGGISSSRRITALLFAALIGTIDVTGTEVGPFLSVEQAIIPQTCDRERRTLAFALVQRGDISNVCRSSDERPPLGLAKQGTRVIGLVQAPVWGLCLDRSGNLLLYMILSDGVESPALLQSKQAARSLLSPESKRVMAKLSGLFALDSFGGGFVLQSFVSYWFYVRFGASLEQISLVFFGAGVLTTLPFLAAEKLAMRIGLVNTMGLHASSIQRSSDARSPGTEPGGSDGVVSR